MIVARHKDNVLFMTPFSNDFDLVQKFTVPLGLNTVYNNPVNYKEAGLMNRKKWDMWHIDIPFSIMNDEVTMLIDTTGAGLHKRGYRLSQNGAPIKETLAASICALAKLRHYHTLYDPMCGSGTLLIEGALYAHNIAPGLNRHFAAERFDVLPKNIWKEEKERAISLEKVDTDFVGYGSDIDGEAIKIALENASRLPIGKKLHFEKRDIKDFQKRSERGTVICNPPYGERLLDLQEAQRLYREMGRVFDKAHGWSYYVITPDEEFEQCFGRKADKSRKLYNGMIKCRLHMYFK